MMLCSIIWIQTHQWYQQHIREIWLDVNLTPMASSDLWLLVRKYMEWH